MSHQGPCFHVCEEVYMLALLSRKRSPTKLDALASGLNARLAMIRPRRRSKASPTSCDEVGSGLCFILLHSELA